MERHEKGWHGKAMDRGAAALAAAAPAGVGVRWDGDERHQMSGASARPVGSSRQAPPRFCRVPRSGGKRKGHTAHVPAKRWARRRQRGIGLGSEEETRRGGRYRGGTERNDAKEPGGVEGGKGGRKGTRVVGTEEWAGGVRAQGRRLRLSPRGRAAGSPCGAWWQARGSRSCRGRQVGKMVGKRGGAQWW